VGPAVACQGELSFAELSQWRYDSMSKARDRCDDFKNIFAEKKLRKN
jgi:hypothetical protein